MKVNQAAIDIIKQFEGFRAEAYLDKLAQPPVWTIGYGTTTAADVGIVPRAGTIITEDQAEVYLLRAVQKFAAQIAPLIVAPINENEFGAFVSLAYNIGPGAFARSTALKRFNAGDKAGAANAMLAWNKAGGKVYEGLKRRRAAERALFLTAPATEKPVAAEPPKIDPNIGKAIAPLTDNHGGFWASFWFYVLLPLMALFGRKQ